MITIEEHKALGEAGFIPGPDESESDFVKRLLQKGCTNCISGDFGKSDGGFAESPSGKIFGQNPWCCKADG